jgi:acetyl esterase/lipase
VHGGYWQWNDKEGQACAAAGLLAHGFNVAVVEYTLCPDVGIGDIVDEVWSSLDWLARHGAEYGADGTRIVATGISAGGHLAATQLAHPAVKAGLLMSGIYDLEPIRHTWLNGAVGMDAETAHRHSPLHHIPEAAGPVVFAVGGAELPALRQQTGAYHSAWIGRGHRGRRVEVPAADHFSIFDQFITPEGRLCLALRDLARGTGLTA